jgi:hypothetical protein
MVGRKSNKIESLKRRIASLEDRHIDELYGLEPVYEPGQGGTIALMPEEFVAFQCPWCGERMETKVDLTAGPRSYVEDCQVCCRPMELAIELEHTGALRALRVQRLE